MELLDSKDRYRLTLHTRVYRLPCNTLIRRHRIQTFFQMNVLGFIVIHILCNVHELYTISQKIISSMQKSNYIRTTVFFNVTLCSLVEVVCSTKRRWTFTRLHYLTSQRTVNIFLSSRWGSTFLRNVRKCLQDYMAHNKLNYAMRSVSNLFSYAD
jgi:hypothetical protein